MLKDKKWPSIVITVIVATAFFISFGSASDTPCVPCQTEVCEDCGCTSLGVGKDATVDGSIIIVQSNDCGVCDPRILYHPAADHLPGEMRELRYIPQLSEGGPIEDAWVVSPYAIAEVPHTYAYFTASQFGAMNEHQLAIAESTRGSVKEVDVGEGLAGYRGPITEEDVAEQGIVGLGVTELSRIALERCTTAREAIKLMGALAETYGFTSYSLGESLFVSDTEEVWLWELVRPGPEWKPDSITGIDPTGRSGCAWAAQKVPDDEVVLFPNVPRIGEIDLSDTDNFMASDNISSLAVELGLWDPESGEPFVMYKAYSNKKASLRLWNLYRLIAPSKYDRPFTDNLDEYPFSIKPDKKLTVWDVAALYRDHGEGTEYDNTTGLKAGPWGNPFNPNANRFSPSLGTDDTRILQTRSWLPDPVGGIIWYAPDTANAGVFVPFYCGITRLPKPYTTGNSNKFSLDSAWWVFDFVNNWSTLYYNQMMPIIQEVQASLEAKEAKEVLVVDATALGLYAAGVSEAEVREYLTDYSITNANNVVDRYWELANKLLCEFDDRPVSRPKPPQWWKDAVK